MNRNFVINHVWQGYGNDLHPKIMALLLLRWEAAELEANLGNGPVREEALQTVPLGDSDGGLQTEH